jgi:hypothetical protein
MLSRREMLAGTMFSRVAVTPSGEVGDQSTTDRDALKEIQRAIGDVQRAIEREHASLPMSGGAVATLRRLFETFVRANGKFPDFCEVGLNAFYDIYDWHIRNRQQIVITRQADNRYTIQFMLTTLILKTENELSFIGIPYDKA